MYRYRCVVGLIVAVLALGGCATPPPKQETPEGPVYYPPPPATARFVHETTIRASTDIHVESDRERLRRMMIGQDLPVRTFEKPFDIAARNGRIYVTDTLGRRVHVFDVPRRRYYVFGVRFEGTLVKPAGIALDRQGNVYVADVRRRNVVVYDGLGLYRRHIGRSELLVRPTGVAVSPAGDRVYVVDNGGVDDEKHRVVVFDADGNRVSEIGRRGAGPGEFNLPVDAAAASDGTLYVLDAGNFRVQAFDRDGVFLRSWGSVGISFGQFARPRHIAVDDSGNVYVSDASFGNIQIFNPRGELLLPIGRRDETDGPGRFALVAGVAVDETGRIYAVDQVHRKIEVFRPLTEEQARSAAP